MEVNIKECIELFYFFCNIRVWNYVCGFLSNIWGVVWGINLEFILYIRSRWIIYK